MPVREGVQSGICEAGGLLLPRRDGLVLQGQHRSGMGGMEGGSREVLMEVLSSGINTVAEGNDCSEPRRKMGGAKRSGGSQACVVAVSYNAWGIPACGNHGNQVRTQTDAI